MPIEKRKKNFKSKKMMRKMMTYDEKEEEEEMEEMMRKYDHWTKQYKSAQCYHLRLFHYC